MNKKIPFLVLGYVLGGLAAVASISAFVYTRAKSEVILAAVDCGGGCKPDECTKHS